MDVSKLHITTLNDPNGGLCYIALQAVTRILDIWDAMRGEVLNTTPPTLDLLVKPTLVTAYTAAKTIWSKKNAQGLRLIQATVSPVIWQDYNTLGTTKEVLDALETTFGAARGALTYLQLVNMVKIQFANLMDLLPQIQVFQDNITGIANY